MNGGSWHVMCGPQLQSSPTSLKKRPFFARLRDRKTVQEVCTRLHSYEQASTFSAFSTCCVLQFLTRQLKDRTARSNTSSNEREGTQRRPLRAGDLLSPRRARSLVSHESPKRRKKVNRRFQKFTKYRQHDEKRAAQMAAARASLLGPAMRRHPSG